VRASSPIIIFGVELVEAVGDPGLVICLDTFVENAPRIYATVKAPIMETPPANIFYISLISCPEIW